MIRTQVYHNAWRELCEGMAAARSLDEVIEVHDLYLLTIQRQCFVVPDKLVGCCLCLRAYVPFCYYSKNNNWIRFIMLRQSWIVAMYSLLYQWALIATRINNILGLALDFYSIQLTLSGGAVSAIKAKCEMEVDRIEKQFDDCIAFLLRVSFSVSKFEIKCQNLHLMCGFASYADCAGTLLQTQCRTLPAFSRFGY